MLIGLNFLSVVKSRRGSKKYNQINARPIKLKQQSRYLENITPKILPDDPPPMYFCGYLQRKVNGRVNDILYKRLDSRLAESEYWENCFTHFNLSPSDLKK